MNAMTSLEPTFKATRDLSLSALARGVGTGQRLAVLWEETNLDLLMSPQQSKRTTPLVPLSGDQART